ncbi:MAG: hypothetical protein NZ957_01390 [Thaumarchaeota archaeon]|nr:hypothetical protein [Candidatus Calditenuaceae archaeon]
MPPRCESCGSDLKRINVLRGRFLCDRCYDVESGKAGEVCPH